MGIGALLGIAKGEGTPEGYDPGMEADGTHPTAAAPPPAKQKPLAGAWKDFLNAPGNHAALIQFGIKALQPISPGQSPMGHLANALGEAGEARSRNIAETADAEMKRAQTDYYSGRSTYYASGGPRGGLTAYQQAQLQIKQDARMEEVLDQVAFQHGGVMGWATLDPEKLTEVVAIAQNRFRELYGTEPPGGINPGIGTGTPTPSLGAATAPAAIPDQRDTNGQLWRWTNNAWAQVPG